MKDHIGVNCVTKTIGKYINMNTYTATMDGKYMKYELTVFETKIKFIINKSKTNQAVNQSMIFQSIMISFLFNLHSF